MQNMCMFLTCTVLVSRWIYYWGFELKFRLQSLVIRICELVMNCCVINFRGFGCCIQNRDRIMERIGWQAPTCMFCMESYTFLTCCQFANCSVYLLLLKPTLLISTNIFMWTLKCSNVPKNLFATIINWKRGYWLGAFFHLPSYYWIHSITNQNQILIGFHQIWI